MNCKNCGHENPPSTKFCRQCGTPLPSVAPSVATPPTTGAQPGLDIVGTPRRPEIPTKSSPLPSKAGSARGLSIWWLIVPTLIYGFLSRNIISTLILAGLGAGLKFAQGRQEVPTRFKPYLFLLQPVLAFVFLGGNPIVIAAVAAAIVGVIRQSGPLIHALEPWWQIQQQIPLIARRVLGFVLTLVIGYYFGMHATGSEWTYTFLSMVTATTVMFLMTFTPPVSIRRPSVSSPHGV